MNPRVEDIAISIIYLLGNFLVVLQVGRLRSAPHTLTHTFYFVFGPLYPSPTEAIGSGGLVTVLLALFGLRYFHDDLI